MARNNDRHFSESGSLNARDLGASFPEAEERLPAWAREREEAQAQEKTADDSKTETEPETPETEAETDDADGDEPEIIRGRATRTRRDEAADAWDREAKRVEGGQRGRTRSREQDGGEETDRREKKTRQGKAPGNGKRKGKGRKKKNLSQEEERRGFVKLIAIILVCGAVFVMIAMMVVSNFVPGLPILALPRRIVTSVIAPIQSAFSGVTDQVVSYLRTLKIRGNLEYEYEQLLIKLDDMANDSALVEELRRENQSLKLILNEWESDESHMAMNPLFAQVIGTTGNNYFATLTLNVGAADGVTDYMAVVDNGGLVGVTYNTEEHTCQVRCVIDSDCTVAGMVQTSRDQGSVKGTLGTNGEAMCRMYYLPDNSLPRPGDVVITSGVGLEFPKGIPIGTIRESTRGMEDNKSYVVLEPIVDFQHLEYVTVYRYRPSYAENAQSRVTTSQNVALEPLTTARPIPTFAAEGVSDFMYSNASKPNAAQATDTPAPEIEETPAPPTPTAEADVNATPVPENLEYHAADRSGATATPSPRPTFTPTPSPAPTPDAGAMTVEDDE